MSLHSLMFGWEYPPLHSGGLGVACQGLVRGLLGNGIEVTLVLPMATDTDDGVRVLHPEDGGCTVYAVRSALQPYEQAADYAARVGGSAITHALYGPDLAAAVERYAASSVDLTRDVRTDVIHCHDWMTFEAGIRARDRHGVPLIAHVHATELDRTNFRPDPWIEDIERRGLRAADRVIAVSRYTKTMLADHYGIDPGKIAVVHNAHDLRAETRIRVDAGPQRKHPLVLFLGRLTVQKNPWTFLEVASRVLHLRPDARFVMAGDGPLLGSLMERACAMGLGDTVTFTGKATNSEVEALYQRADCFVMPSLSEPFGLVALEAIAHGVPVILSRQSGVSEVVDHAFKVDFWDAEKMADCILTILREQPLARQLSAEAPRLLQKLTWSRQAGLVQSLYEHAMTNRA